MKAMIIETVASFELPVAEALDIKRTRFGKGTTSTEPGPRLCVAGGSHGDETEILALCAILAARLTELEDGGKLKGTIDLYPALNPLGIDTASRTMPMFNTDLNRAFSLDNKDDTSFMKALSASIAQSMKGADIVVHLHVSNPAVLELPQVRLNVRHQDLLQGFANKLGLPFIWVHGDIPALQNSLSYVLNDDNTPCLSIEAGASHRLLPGWASGLAEAVLRLAALIGGIEEKPAAFSAPLISSDGTVHQVYSQEAGLFQPSVSIGSFVGDGSLLGSIVNPYTGVRLQEVQTPSRGLVVTLREHPVTAPGGLLARIYEGPGIHPAGIDFGGQTQKGTPA